MRVERAQRERQAEREDKARHRRADGIDEVVGDGLAEGRIGKDGLEVPEPAKGRQCPRRPLQVQAVPDHLENGAVREQGEREQRGQQQRVAGDASAILAHVRPRTRSRRALNDNPACGDIGHACSGPAPAKYPHDGAGDATPR